jgi:RNA polymerase sigma factor (sigma-70 family)
MVLKEDFIEKCRRKERSALKQLYEFYSDKMFGVCISYAQDRAEAEDILHEGFMKVFNNIAQFKGSGSLEGWIRRIMVNTALEKFRKQKRIFVIPDMQTYEEDLSSTHILEDITAEEIMELIRSLTPQYRMVFMLYAIEGYSHKEIGAKLSISEGTSKSNLSRARFILQEKIKSQYQQDHRPIKKKLKA